MPELLTYVLIALAVAALLGVVLEEVTHVNKAKVTLFFGTLAWLLLFIFAPAGEVRETVLESLNENIAEIAGLWIFLVAAMTFVAYLNKKGMIENLIYLVLPQRISERALLFLTATFCFVFSSLADNITATLVSITLILSLQLDRAKTIKFATLVVFAVNSGGVALITGDVTTLMIFLAGKVAILQLLVLAVPAFIAVMVLAAMLSIGMRGEVVVQAHRKDVRGVDVAIALIFLCTILGTIIGNFLFQIPPVLTFLAGLSVMFLVARFFSDDNDSDPILEYVRQVEFETLFFFLGILLLVGMLKEVRVLDGLVHIYDQVPAVMANYLMGVMSAAIDNVPLTAALLKSGLQMGVAEWMVLTYAVGVGGSLLVIGSAAGIVAMSKVPGLTFGSYLRHMLYLFIAFNIGFAGVYLIGLSIG
ncbi:MULTISPECIES: sodium:proton antiporter NhaD [Stutzerimonas]|uniref:Sodium:proton antiporter NhaD n=1 Tax=Stutzerimonas frequens TaxID=2968969 RepID=A0AA47I071_9GAMM|nr:MULTISPECIES: sodium:proton antiporter NhaD [Stutzerimonas]MAL93426.1 sodium:proton antiporter [Pseudomonas sp.]MCD1640039.1 sodium:proton antiporter NhaD [Stutzerimonas stutzeri]AWT10990.1 sodium:proton antiporter [Stutzerimonas frequens]KZX59948.1 sodium:proton antiporter [Stutzerimonas frequens]MBK3757925.1 sodium:proton antiporter [Stutzerimonas frequens]|tara:strand:- start:139 stop:1392 length:1254 start_codon:yes stop_codon:yes gene_type:complete